MYALAELLAKLYPERDAVRLLLLDIGLDPEDIDLDGAAVVRWRRVLDCAWKHKTLRALVGSVRRKYTAQATELDRALEQYCSHRKQEAGAVDLEKDAIVVGEAMIKAQLVINKPFGSFSHEDKQKITRAVIALIGIPDLGSIEVRPSGPSDREYSTENE